MIDNNGHRLKEISHNLLTVIRNYIELPIIAKQPQQFMVGTVVAKLFDRYNETVNAIFRGENCFGRPVSGMPNFSVDHQIIMTRKSAEI